MNTLADFIRRASRMLEQGSGDLSSAYWSIATDVLLTTLQASPDGLQGSDITQRLRRYGPNTIKAHEQATAVGLFLSQFRSPLVLILVFAAPFRWPSESRPTPASC